MGERPRKLSKKLLKLAEKDAENAGEDPSPHFPNASPALFIPYSTVKERGGPQGPLPFPNALAPAKFIGMSLLSSHIRQARPGETFTYVFIPADM
jgi:hypothetical protein